MRRTSFNVVACLLAGWLCIGSSVAQAAATVGPKLSTQLAVANAGDVIPVIITLSDRVNLRQFRDKKRSVRRSKIIRALKDKATRSQRGLKAFLKTRGASGMQHLWLTNAVAVRLPVSVIRRVKRFPGVESIRLDETVSLPVMAAAIPDISIDDVSVDETAGNAAFTVSLSTTSNDTVTVNYATSSGTAISGFDFTATSGPLTFSPGETSQPVTVPITDDTAIEDVETFTVTLTSPVNALLADDTGVGTIIDDDIPRLRIDDVSVDESASAAVFTITRTGATAPTLLVDVASVDVTATDGVDYAGILSGTQLTFFGGGVSSMTVSVTIQDDQLAEGDETFLVVLSNPVNAVLSDASAIGTIVDNDMPVLGIDDVAVTESAGMAVYTVTRAGDTSTPVTVEYATQDGSATTVEGDYQAVSGQLSFATGVTSQTIEVPVLADMIVEGDETFSVILNNPVDAVIVDDTGEGTIFGTQPPSGPTFWNLDAIYAPDLWAQGFIGQGIVVANMDSGVDITHPDLAMRWRGGTNSWFDVHGEHPVIPFDAAGTATGHGTRSMGLMVAGDASGATLGVAPGARWIAVKAWDDNGNAQLSHFTLGAQWLLDPDGDPSTDDAPDVVNNSWKLDQPAGTCTYDFQAEIQALQAAGIAVVFSAGNEGAQGAGSSVSPANNPEGYGVGSVDNTLNVSGFSSRGPSACDGTVFPEVTAPGKQVWTTDLSAGGLPSLIQATGTSFASPHVAGAMALLLSAFPDTSFVNLETALISTARDLGNPGPDDDYGHGLIDVLEAYNWLAADSDNDGVRDVDDNCSNAPNGSLIPDAGGNSQLDTDGDGYGNLCDADLDQTGFVDFADLTAFSGVFFSADPDADLNGDGFVDFADLTLFSGLFFQAAGPSCCGIPLP